MTFTVLTVTGASPERVAALVALHEKAAPHHMRCQYPAAYFTEALGEERNINIVMENEKGTVIGHLLGIPLNKTFEELRRWDPDMRDDPESLYLDMIQVAPEHRGANLGLHLIRALCKEAERRGIGKLSMHARTTTGWSKHLHRIFTEVQVLRRVENWYGFGEPFDYLEAMPTVKDA